jgi:hypothetical protein
MQIIKYILSIYKYYGKWLHFDIPPKKVSAIDDSIVNPKEVCLHMFHSCLSLRQSGDIKWHMLQRNG